MSRKLPAFIPGHYYHLYNRGRSRLPIFHEADNYTFVLRKLKTYLAELQIAIIAYVLMPNHYHFLVRQDGDKAAGLLVQRIFNSYSKAYNKRFAHSGTLFEGPYDARHVHDEAYLRHLCRYIHANPVKDGLAQHIEEWPYSNYHEWMGLRAGTLVDREFVNDYFPDRNGYKEFVVQYLLHRRLSDNLEYLGEW